MVKKQQMSALTLEMQKVKADGAFANFVYNCNVEDVCPWSDAEAKPIEKAKLNTLTDGEKRFMLKQILCNTTGEGDLNLQSTKPGEMLSDEDLTATHELLQWHYKQPYVALAPPNVVKVLAVEGTSSIGGIQCIADIQEMMKTKKVVVLPIHAELHWTAVVLWMKEIGSLDVDHVDYVDFAEPIAVLNRNYARKVLRLLTLGESGFLKLPEKKFNRYRQKAESNDCGFAVWYPLELAFKVLRHEGERKLMPTPEVWREQLANLKRSLAQAGQKWKLADAAKKKPKPVEVVLPDKKPIADKFEAKAMLDLKVKEGLRMKFNEFFGCARCRWTTVGVGCDLCNPAKAEDLKAYKAKQTEDLKNQLDAWLEECRSKGQLVEHVPEYTTLETKKLVGGDSTMSVEMEKTYIYIYIYIYV